MCTRQRYCGYASRVCSARRADGRPGWAQYRCGTSAEEEPRELGARCMCASGVRACVRVRVCVAAAAAAAAKEGYF